MPPHDHPVPLALLAGGAVVIPQDVVGVDDQGGDRVAIGGQAQLGRDAQDAGELDHVLVLEWGGHGRFSVCVPPTHGNLFSMV